ncbi:MAG TPA: protein kinase [Anaerolineales bacterium]|nr:protein kinase [Anaerolineales bacterium]
MAITDPLIDTQLANFRVVRVLGRGGMATVYFGWDVKLERPVAIKVIDARYRENPAYTRRFQNEARAVAALRHEHILQVHYADEENGLYYFVMEYVRGPDLENLLEKYARREELIPTEDVLRIAHAVASALDYAHTSGVIHRDVKPANVLVAEDGRVVLMDFGLAMNVELGTSGDVFGSPHYMSPEQVRSSAEAVPASDLYALGVMLYEMLTGEVPFDDENPVVLASKHTNETPALASLANPGLDEAVDVVLARALAKSPRDRFASGRELVEALEAAFVEAARRPPPAPTLPELPDGGKEVAAQEAKRISRVTLAELTEAYVAEHYSEAAADPPQPGGIAPRPPVPARRNARLLRRFGPWALGGGGCFLLIALVGLALLLVSAANPGGRDSPGRTQSPTDTAESVTDPSIRPPATNSQGLPPTPLEGGDYHEAYYDDTAFYLRNLSGNDRPIAPIAFERIHNNGSVLDRFEGRRWSQFYSTHEEGLCVVIEIINYVDHLDPPECRNRHVITRTPTLEEGEDYIFWTVEGGSKVFRVLWHNVEVARCEIAEGYCEIYLP